MWCGVVELRESSLAGINDDFPAVVSSSILTTWDSLYRRNEIRDSPLVT